jgi:RHS repeat-associated protein
LQPILLSASSPSATVFSDSFDFHLGAGDNGNVFKITNNRDNTRSQSFTYDVLNRIASAQSSGTQWGETFTIDAWGNLTNETGITGKIYSEGLNTSVGTNNQLSGFGYDAAGNMTSYGTASYVYDAENRLIWTSGYRYLYDGDGQRVEKCAAATSTTACPTSGTNGTLYWRGLGSDPLSETDLSGNVQNTYVFFGGQRVARRDSAGAIHYYFSDHLGSHGVVENAAASSCEQDIDYYPYGGEENDYCSTPVAQHHKFTGKERDAESGLDYLGARHHASSLGRFMSPDPVHVLKQKLVDPQQWNMYAYVRNNPLRFVDPKGKWLQLIGGDKERKKQLQALQEAVGKEAGSYLYDNAVTTTDANGNKVTNHYVGIKENGPDGNGASFGSINAAATKLGGIIQDTNRGAAVTFVEPGTRVGNDRVGSIDQHMTPGLSVPYQSGATIYLTSGPTGSLPGDLLSDGRAASQSLGEVLSHEIGEVDSAWYHGDVDSRGDGVRMENQTRQLRGDPLRVGHDIRGDVQLYGAPY